MLQSCPTLCNPIDGSPRLPRPWDSPGKNTGVGCHFLLQCRKVKSKSEVAQSCPTRSSVHGIFQARVLEWGAIAFSEKEAYPPFKNETKLMFQFSFKKSKWKMVWSFLRKLEIKPPYDPAIPLLGIYPEETKIEKASCIPLFITALFTISRT